MSEKRDDFSDNRLHFGTEIMPRLALLLVISIVGGFIGEAYSAIFYANEGESYYQGFRNGFTIAFLTSVLEIFYVNSGRKSWLRRLAFLPSLLVRILIVTLIVRLTLVSNEAISQWFRGEPIGFGGDLSEEVRDTIFSLGFIVFFTVVLQFSSLIGIKRFGNLMAGRYFRPVAEERIFLFVDLIGSSATARKLGDVRFHEYLADFFQQLDRAIVRNGGEIVAYVGDAVIVTWPLRDKPERNNVCLKTVMTMNRMLKRQSGYFEKEYGQIPEFRAALHGGSVVVGECGDSRRQITFLGDAVNTTARIEDVSKVTEERFIISDALAQRVLPPQGVSLEELGIFELKGLGESFKLHAMRLRRTA